MRGGWIAKIAKSLLATVLLVAAMPSVTGGCVVNEPESPPRGVVVSGPPPAPVREERPPAPNAQSIWVAGYWHWTGMQYAWIPGHWEAPPVGSVWAEPKVTALKDGRYVYEAGGWSGPPAPAGSRNAIR